jgi:hypothetical protein
MPYDLYDRSESGTPNLKTHSNVLVCLTKSFRLALRMGWCS